jgi:hypothetical protein
MLDIFFKNLFFQHYIIIACAIFSTFFIKKATGIKKVPVVLIIANALFDTIVLLVLLNEGIKSNLIYSIWFSVECMIILGFYHYSGFFIKQTKMFFILLFFMVLLFILNMNYFETVNEFQSNSVFLLGLLVFAISYLNLRKLLINNSNSKYELTHWFIIGNVIYFGLLVQSIAGTMAMISLKDNRLSNFFYNLNNVGYSLWGICLTIGIVLHKNER